MTRSVEIPEEAVEAAAQQLHPTLWGGQPGNRHAESARNDTRERVRLVLTAALPYLAPAEPAKCHRCGYALRPDDTYTRLDGTTYHLRSCPDRLPAPVGDGGLREALEQHAEVWRTTGGPLGVSYATRVRDLIAAHPAAPAVPQPVDREALLDRDAVENAIATKAMYYDSGTAVHEVDDNDLAGLVAATDAIMQLVRPVPTLGQVKAAIRTGLGGDTEDEACGCESHICSAADAVLAVLAGEQEQVEP